MPSDGVQPSALPRLADGSVRVRSPRADWLRLLDATLEPSERFFFADERAAGFSTDEVLGAGFSMQQLHDAAVSLPHLEFSVGLIL